MTYKRTNIILSLSFLLSGISGLIYEVLWAKYLSLIFGNTTYAHTLVLSTFMGGLALGSFLLGKLSDRSKDRLAFYMWVQICIALFCILTPNLFAFSKNFYLAAAKNLSLNPTGIIITKFIIGILIILPPTILMGGTLPILSKFMTQSFSERGKTIAYLYYINSLGAVLGTLLAGFYLIYFFGLETTVTIAAVINLAAGVLVYILRGNKEECVTQETADSNEEGIYPEKIIAFSLFAIFLSGFVAMLYEIAWIRMLSIILGSSTYSFSLMLAAFISGITIGSFLISRLMPKDTQTFLYFGFCEIFIAVSLILTIPFYEKLPFLFFKLSGIFSRKPETFLFYVSIKFFISFLVMLPPTIFLGMTLPLVSKIVSDRLESLGEKVGGVFGYNMIGNILGALISGLVLIPFLGLKLALEFGVIINLALGITVLLMDKMRLVKHKMAFICICCLVFLGYKVFIPDWNKAYFTTEVFRYRQIPKNEAGFSGFSRMVKDRDILFYKDGLDATVSVVKFNENSLSLFVNGKSDASTYGDMPTQILLAQVPLLLKPQAKDVLVVGLGSGVTCGSALLHPLDNLDVVEISSTVVQANSYFSRFNYNPLQNKRLHLFVEDAKTFLQRMDKKYDVIISEPSNPWMTGIGSLFSKEFFNECIRHLNESGLMVQWVQTYEMDDETFKIIVRTFSSVFPEINIWKITGTQDILLLGSKQKITLQIDESEKRINQKSIKEDLARIKLYDLFTLLSLQLASDENIRNHVGDKGILNSDYRPVLDYRAPLALYTKSSINNFLSNMDERNVTLENNDLLIKNYLPYRRIDYNNLRSLYLNLIQDKKNSNLLFSLVNKWRATYPEDKEATLAYFSLDIAGLEESVIELEKLAQKDNSFEYLDMYASFLVKKYSALRSFLAPEVLSDTVERLKLCANLSEDKKARFYYLLGNVFLENRDYKNSLVYYTKVEELIKSKEKAELQKINYMQLFKNMYFAYLNEGRLEEAAEYEKRISQ